MCHSSGVQYCRVFYCGGFIRNYNFYRFRQIFRHPAADTIPSVCYFEEGIRSPRIYLAFVRLFVVSVDLEYSTSQNHEKHLISCITIACVSYIRVFMLVRQCQVGLNANQVQGNARFHLGRYKSTVRSTIYVFGFLLLCYMPYLCLSVAARRSEQNTTLSLWVHLALVLVYANSSFNPALYCWRIPEIRQIARETFGKFFCKI